MSNESTPAAQPAIQAQVDERGPLRRGLRVEVPAERVSRAFDRAYARLQANVRMPGFRKGKVPRKVLEKEYGERVRQDVVRDLIEDACAEALRAHALDIVTAPILVDQDLEEQGTLRFTAEVEVRPEFELKNYKGRELVLRIRRVTDEDVDNALQRLRERMAQLVTEEDRVNVARGDVVVFDMEASAGGQKIESASGEGIQLEVGAGRFPEDFEKQLVGVTRGIRTPIDVRFPDDHGDAELAGKLVRFEVTVREIKNKILPALDDDFVRELDFEGCDTLDDLRKKVRQDLERHARLEAERRARNELVAELVREHGFPVPEGLVRRQIQQMLHEMGVHELPEDKGQELVRALEPAATDNVKARFVLDAVAKAEGLEVTREELEQEVRRQIAAAGEQADRVREYYSTSGAVAQLAANVLREKALQRIIELSAQREEFVTESELADSRGSGYAR